VREIEVVDITWGGRRKMRKAFRHGVELIDKLDRFRERIHAVLPALHVSSMLLAEQGQNNDVLRVNEDLIFRFPRYSEGIERLEREANLLRIVVKHATLPVPDPFVASFEIKEAGSAFMGYRAINGSPLEHDALRAFRDEVSVQALATDLAMFLRTLHNIPLDEIPSGFTQDQFHPRQEWADLYTRIQLKLFPHMSPAARAWATVHFEEFLHDPRNQEITSVLVHGDFGPTNILTNSSRSAVTGIIDFGSAHQDDPAVDLAAVSTVGQGFLNYFMWVYPGIESALHRVRFYKGTFALQEALFGIETGDRAALQAGMADIPPSPGMSAV